MLRRGHRVGIAVSGGVDSVSLLHVLGELAEQLDLSLAVLHLNHKLRGVDSDNDAAFVRGLAEGLQLPFIEDAVDVRAMGGNLEQAGRAARHSLYSRAIASGAVDRVATGHTRSDQAETVLYRILRGSGTAGLAGIAPVTESGIIRPLLECDRVEVEEFARKHGLSWREDTSNEDHRFVRNRIRHCLLPMLKQEYNPALGEILSGMAATARTEEDYWGGETERLFKELARFQTGAVLLETAAFAGLHLALQRRLIREAIRVSKGDLLSIGVAHIEQVLSLVRTKEGDGIAEIPGLCVQRSFNWLRFVAGGPKAEPAYEVPIEPPARVSIPLGRSICVDVVEFSALNGINRYNEVSFLDVDRLCGPLTVRNWRPGDRFSPQGADKKIKHLFQRARIPNWERKGWPVMTSGDKVVWCRQFGASKEVAPGANTRTVLSVREEPGGD